MICLALPNVIYLLNANMIDSTASNMICFAAQNVIDISPPVSRGIGVPENAANGGYLKLKTENLKLKNVAACGPG